jgi:uncharacterized membrane protein
LQKLLTSGLLIFLLGIGLLIVGAAAQGVASAGGVIFIGPVPIVFGTGPSGASLALLSVAIGVVMLVLLAFWSRRHFGGGSP